MEISKNKKKKKMRKVKEGKIKKIQRKVIEIAFNFLVRSMMDNELRDGERLKYEINTNT